MLLVLVDWKSNRWKMKGYNFITTLVKEKIFCNLHLRPFDIFVKEHFGDKQIVGAEIGVLAGCHAFSMLSHNSNIRMLHLIDPYKNYVTYEKNYTGNGITINDYEQIAHKTLGRFDNRIHWIPEKFQDCVNELPQLDFCYYDIDGNYQRTKEFIDLYWNKIFPGGVIGGWNYDAGHRGVPDAVGEFVDEKISCLIDGIGNDWRVVKDKKG